ncbi:MAG: hypothetical protein VZS44_11520 [Bacilli bacterium]|nr:hypothetical protein [Bacilli bacterium]
MDNKLYKKLEEYMLNVQFTHSYNEIKIEDLFKYFLEEGYDIHSAEFKEAYIKAHNSVEEICWGKTDDNSIFSDYTSLEKEILEETY